MMSSKFRFRSGKCNHDWHQLSSLITVWICSKFPAKNLERGNKSNFPGNLYKIFCLWCTFLQELTIHDYESLLLAEKF